MLKVDDKVICVDNGSHSENDKLTIGELKLNKIYTIRIFFDNDTRKRTQYYTDLLFFTEINGCYYYPSYRFMKLSDYNRKKKLLKIEKCVNILN